MVKIYADLIISGHIEYEGIPESRKEAVSAELQERGYNTEGSSF